MLSFLGFGVSICGMIVGFAGGMLLCLMGLERFGGLFGVEISKDTKVGIAAIAGLLFGGLPFGYLACYWARRQLIIKPREAGIAKFEAELVAK